MIRGRYAALWLIALAVFAEPGSPNGATWAPAPEQGQANGTWAPPEQGADGADPGPAGS
jgi:hypothetical protein